ncbi:PASTA domain-containing protein [Streptomyces sp. 549]|uniref:PASTA domain-containing protein n=1 Tax=Streptomyces sp. 549 TaxID=3049076 RepID=UPI0024C2ABBF|nr:PASTA domain-containing protein [Streptomyces sp. 549]MDK1476312.1 PASTA domain-containing protein [Streptomyces sp. 549]
MQQSSRTPSTAHHPIPPRTPPRRSAVASAARVLGAVALGVALAACGGAPAEPEPSTSAAGAASPEPPKTPNYVAQSLPDAERAAEKAGYRTTRHNASGSEQADSWLVGDWKVCFQKEKAPASGSGKPLLRFGAAPTADPCPSTAPATLAWAEFPDVVGATHARATARINALGVRDITTRGAYTNAEPPARPDSWKVCFQEPEAGTEAPFADDLAVLLHLVAPGTACPDKTGTRLPPPPKPTPPPAPATTAPAPDPGPPATETGGSSGGTSGGTTGGTTGGDSGGGTSSGGQTGVHPGSFCSPPGALGSTVKGTPMRCTTTATDDRYRWRAA